MAVFLNEDPRIDGRLLLGDRLLKVIADVQLDESDYEKLNEWGPGQERPSIETSSSGINEKVFSVFRTRTEAEKAGFLFAGNGRPVKHQAWSDYLVEINR